MNGNRIGRSVGVGAVAHFLVAGAADSAGTPEPTGGSGNDGSGHD